MVRIPTHRAPTHPGEMLLKEFLEPMKISQSALAEGIGVTFARVNELVNGKRGISPETALRLERFLGMEAQFWMNLQLRWDLYHAAHSAKAKEIAKIRRHAARVREALGLAVLGGKVVSAADFKANCLSLMDEVREKGSEFLITKHNVPVARLVPVLDETGNKFIGRGAG